jgi:hypothetical protein
MIKKIQAIPLTALLVIILRMVLTCFCKPMPSSWAERKDTLINRINRNTIKRFVPEEEKMVIKTPCLKRKWEIPQGYRRYHVRKSELKAIYI